VISVLPVATPDTKPALLTVATDVVPLVHDNVLPEPVRLVLAPSHKLSVPDIVGLALMVTMADLLQPVPIVYAMVVVPGTMPVTMPVTSMVPIVVLLLLHVPPPVALPRLVDVPGHAFSVPVIAGGSVCTVIVIMERQLPRV
jgi:hypothetical protein